MRGVQGWNLCLRSRKKATFRIWLNFPDMRDVRGRQGRSWLVRGVGRAGSKDRSLWRPERTASHHDPEHRDEPIRFQFSYSRLTNHDLRFTNKDGVGDIRAFDFKVNFIDDPNFSQLLKTCSRPNFQISISSNACRTAGRR
jgi:hypothetical protein